MRDLSDIRRQLKEYCSRFLKIDKKLLAACILSLLVPITLNGIYFLFSHFQLTRQSEFRQAQNNVDRIADQLNEIMGKAVDIANRIYVNARIHQTVAQEYRTPLQVYNAYNDIPLFDDYLRSYKEIAGIRLYVENPTMLDSSYFIVADNAVRRESWYEKAINLDGKMFWVYRYDPILRAEYISLVRRIRNTTSGSHVGILCVELNPGNLERICAAELYDTLISLNGAQVCPENKAMDSFTPDGNWIITNAFTPRQTLDSVFEVTCIIPRRTLMAPVYAMLCRSLVIIFASLVISLALIMQIVNDAYIQKLQKEQLFSRQKEMQLEILSNQINPHFLYNTLETIRMMALGKKEREIASTIKMLSQILRQSLSASEKTVPLEKELELVRNYLSIQKLRFSDRLQYTIETDPALLHCSILPLLIQPLVENSVIHGMEKKTGGSSIHICVEAREQILYIEVSDDGLGIEPEQLEKLRDDIRNDREGRIGLVNVNRRIKLFYGPDFGLAIAPGAESGVQVCITLPLIEEARYA